jgi:hypothetical protein
MGAGNAKKVYARWGDLADGPLRLLVYMSLTTLDADERPTFRRGREALAVGLGRMVPDRDTADPGEIAERRRAFKAVDRMILALKESGAITQIEAAGPGHTAAYALNLDLRRTPISGDHSAEWTPANGDQKRADQPPNQGGETEECTPVSGSNGPRSAGQQSPVSGDHCTPVTGVPRSKSRDLRTVEEERVAEVSPTSHPSRERGPSEPAPKVIALFPGTANAPNEQPYRPPPRRTTRAQDAIAEAMARVAARKAEHQAQLAESKEIS